MMLTATMGEITTNIMATTTMVDSGEIMEDIGEMDMMAITITMGIIAQILNLRRTSAKCFVSSATTKAIMPMSTQKRRLTHLPSPILSRTDM